MKEEDSKGTTSRKKFRIDMVITDIEHIKEDKDVLILGYTMVPDPRVWKEEVVNGERGYLNKIDDIFISEKDLAEAAPKLNGIPVSIQSVGMGQAQIDAYLAKSKERLKKRVSK